MCKFQVRQFFCVGFFACVKFIMEVFSPLNWRTFILIVSLAPFLSFYCHLIAALLLLRIIYRVRIAVICLFSSFCTKRSSVTNRRFRSSFFFFFFFGLNSVNPTLLSGRNNISVLWSTFRRAVCYFSLLCLV